MGRALAYIRVSKEKEDGISPELQIAAIEKHCTEHGHTIVETIEDLDLSGRFWKRRQVERAVGMIERREADVLVVWKVSRVSRNRVDWNIAVDRIESIGGQVESATEPMDTTTSSGRFARGVLAELAAFESERIGEQWKEAHARRVRNGLPHSGTEQFGYTRSREGYAPDPETAPVLRQLYMDFIHGKGFRPLADLSAAHAGPTTTTGVRYLLDRGFGAGLITVRKELVKGAHEPVITELEFKRYKTVRKQRGSRPRAESSPYPFSGVVFCECGLSMGGNSPVGQDGAKKRRYTCGAQKNADGHTNSVLESLVEETVLAKLAEVAGEVNSKSKTKLGETGSKRTADARPKLRRDLSKVLAKIDTMTERWMENDGSVDRDTYDRLLAKWQGDRDALQERLDLLDLQAETRDAPPVTPDMLAMWPQMPADVQRGIVKAVIASVTVPRGRTRWNPKPLVALTHWDVR